MKNSIRRKFKEEWCKIDGFPMYSISNKGRIRNDISNRIKKPSHDKDGYLVTLLSNGNKSFSKRVHRLVAQTFIPNPQSKLEVNHINGIKDDNFITNLEWVTSEENIAHAVKNGLIKTNPNKGIKAKYPRSGTHIKIVETGQTFVSVKECADSINGKTRKIFECLNPNKNRHSHRGYHFERIG